jgi:two-component system, cell cycle sensor histidine kinase PleC
MNGGDEATVAMSVGADPSTAGSAPGSPLRLPQRYRFAEDFPAMRAEIERQSRELARCRATIDELQRRVAQATAASSANADLLAEMSHELRNPLGAIIGLSEIMQSEAFGPVGHPTYHTYIDDIIFCGRHLLAIVDDTLDLARCEAGKTVLKEEPVALEAVVDEAVRLVAPMAERAGVALAWLPAVTELPWLRCDRLRVRQILLNALSNAVKFTEPGGRIEIAADLSDGLAVVVSDTGIGIEPDSIELALSRFGQVASSGARHRDGSGLGLTLATALAEQHGGTLTLHSTPRTGTIVRIAFPISRIAARDPGGPIEASAVG